MANKVPDDALKELLDIAAANPNGIAAPSIAERLTEDIPRRTLQYRLKQLVAKGQLHMEGSGRWARYRLAAKGSLARTELDGESLDYRDLIPLSDEGKRIRDYVQQPIAARKPVGYNQDFLNQYQPNTSFYLGDEDRERLERIGKPQTSTQPAGTYAKLILNRLLIDLAWNSSR